MAPPSVLIALGDAIMSAKDAPGDEAALERVRKACTETSLAEEKHTTGQHRGMHGLALSIRAASEQQNKEWGYALVDTVMTCGVKYADARLEAGKTALMLAANVGRDDICDLLLDARASVASADKDGVTPLHAACFRLHGDARAAEAHKVLKMLLMRGGKMIVNTPSKIGPPPLVVVTAQKHCSTSATVKLCELLVRHGAAASVRCAPGWASAYDAALEVHGKDSDVAKLLREKIDAVDDAAATARAEQSEAIHEYFRLNREYLAPIIQAGDKELAAMQAKLRRATSSSDGPNSDDREEAMRELAILAESQTSALVDALARFAGYPDKTGLEDAACDAGSCCGLERLWRTVSAITPRVVLSSWASADELSTDEIGEIEVLSGRAQQSNRPGDASNAAPPPLVVRPPDPGVECFVAGRGIAEAFQRGIVAPMQHAFAFAIPCEAALQALEAHAPLCEVGAGSGYWGACLHARGVDCKLYDLRPPQEGRNAFFSVASAGDVHVEHGDGATVAAAHPERTLLLIWPYSRAVEGAEAQGDGGDGVEPWDAAALKAYTGDVVAHVGALTLDSTSCTRTTSDAFATALSEAFVLEQTVALPQWPHANDALTIWRRRAETGEARKEELPVPVD